MKWPWLAMALAAATMTHAAPKAVCSQVRINGEVEAGREWSASLGQGWVFRVMPIQPVNSGFSGWDLVVDRVPPAGFPDALLLATMPYNSINEREIGTTFGLRAQDAIGWNPRSFRFLMDPRDFRGARQVYVAAFQSPNSSSALQDSRTLARLLDFERRAAQGELRIVDARLVPGMADPAPYAQSWARASERMPHRVEAAQAGASSPRGELKWIRFTLTLLLPTQWKVPAELHAVPTPCGD